MRSFEQKVPGRDRANSRWRQMDLKKSTVAIREREDYCVFQRLSHTKEKLIQVNVLI